jgi:hypothetical protein
VTRRTLSRKNEDIKWGFIPVRSCSEVRVLNATRFVDVDGHGKVECSANQLFVASLENIRFFPREPRDCVECDVEQTRAHVINICTRYTRRRRNFLEFLKNSSDPGREFLEFLVNNPSAFSFADAPPTDN